MSIVLRPISPRAFLATAINDAALRQIVRRELNSNLITGENANVVFAHLAGDVRNHSMTVRELNSERGVRKRVDDTSFHLNCILFRHEPLRDWTGLTPESARIVHKGTPYCNEQRRALRAEPGLQAIKDQAMSQISRAAHSAIAALMDRCKRGSQATE